MCAQYHSLLHSLQKITRSRTKNLIHLEIQLLGPFPQYFYNYFQLYNLLYPVYSVSSKLPLQRFLLLCILSVLPHRGQIISTESILFATCSTNRASTLC